jgi:hypothetical protein
MNHVVRYFRDMWPVYVIGLVLLVVAVVATIDERRRGWHYHSTCEEVTVDMGDVATDMWRCK